MPTCGSATDGGRVINLDAIAAALATLAADPPRDWCRRHETFTPEVLRWMLDGYAELDDILVRGDDPFALGGSRRLVELNHVVLCGKDPERRTAYASHLALTEAHFYDGPEAGADGFFAWAERALEASPIDAAAALYVRMVSAPQLFVEGNQRTATLAASLLLVRGGLPPMVATRDNAAALGRISARARAIRRGAWTAPFQIAAVERPLRRRFRAMLDPWFLRRTDGVAVR